jgi:hypothetical protein
MDDAIDVTRADREAAVVAYYGERWRIVYDVDTRRALLGFVDGGDTSHIGMRDEARRFARHRIASVREATVALDKHCEVCAEVKPSIRICDDCAKVDREQQEALVQLAARATESQRVADAARVARDAMMLAWAKTCDDSLDDPEHNRDACAKCSARLDAGIASTRAMTALSKALDAFDECKGIGPIAILPIDVADAMEKVVGTEAAIFELHNADKAEGDEEKLAQLADKLDDALAHLLTVHGRWKPKNHPNDGVNVCEHGDHEAPPGKRFCSEACIACEHESTGENGCDGICFGAKSIAEVT